MAMTDSNLLDSLPEDLQAMMCSDWLTLKDIGNLDTAMCSKRARPSYLALLASPRTVVERCLAAHERTRFSAAMFPRYSEWVAKRGVRVTQLSFDEDIEDEHVDTMTEAFSRVDSILIFSPQVTDSGLRKISEICTSLKTFRYSCMKRENPGMCRVSDAGVVSLATNCPHLQELTFSVRSGWDTKLLTDSSLFSLSVNCPLLRELDMNGGNSYHRASNESFTNAGVKSIAAGCSSLSSIKGLFNWRVNEETVIFLISTCQWICFDTLINASGIGDKVLYALVGSGRSKHLKSIDTTFDMTTAATHHLITNAPLLECLHIRTDFLADVTLALIAAHCPLLTEVELSVIGDAHLTDNGFLELSGGCPALRHLSLFIEGTNEGDGNGVWNLSENIWDSFPNLEKTAQY